VRRLRALVVVLALAGAVAACGSDQDPGLSPDSTSGGPTTTSHLVPPCPSGGPDAMSPPGDCLDGHGKVLHPSVP
jgi:hypothetical protein